ncbi:hypothetical protein Golax_025651 [Gossypium laxum]|uniref:Uncharacterized protein n=1 Tax=Gossypium laxum TaxID=34288 RepID=A0A7J9B0Z5_9ROSI|nr:hypothetical protein [Gossypium laxum]
MGKLSIPQIGGYLQEVRFLHTSCMLQGYKLDPTLIRYSVITRSTGGLASRHGINSCSGKLDLCRAMLGKAIEQYARAFIMRLIDGILMPGKSQNLVHGHDTEYYVDQRLFAPTVVVALVATIVSTS